MEESAGKSIYRGRVRGTGVIRDESMKMKKERREEFDQVLLVLERKDRMTDSTAAPPKRPQTTLKSKRNLRHRKLGARRWRIYFRTPAGPRRPRVSASTTTQGGDTALSQNSSKLTPWKRCS